MNPPGSMQHGRFVLVSENELSFSENLTVIPLPWRPQDLVPILLQRESLMLGALEVSRSCKWHYITTDVGSLVSPLNGQENHCLAVVFSGGKVEPWASISAPAVQRWDFQREGGRVNWFFSVHWSYTCNLILFPHQSVTHDAKHPSGHCRQKHTRHVQVGIFLIGTMIQISSEIWVLFIHSQDICRAIKGHLGVWLIYFVPPLWRVKSHRCQCTCQFFY